MISYVYIRYIYIYIFYLCKCPCMSAKGSHSNCESIFSLGLPELGATPVRSIVWRPQAKFKACANSVRFRGSWKFQNRNPHPIGVGIFLVLDIYIYIYKYIFSLFWWIHADLGTRGLKFQNKAGKRGKWPQPPMGVTSAGWDGRDRFQREREKEKEYKPWQLMHIYIYSLWFWWPVALEIISFYWILDGLR